jgi:hypothetical protein
MFCFTDLHRLSLLMMLIPGATFATGTTYTTLNYSGALSGSSTFLTGVRGDNEGGVYMTGVYTPPSSSETQGLVYQGPVMGGGDWYILNRPDTPGATTTSTALYGPNTLPGGIIRVAGSYKTSETGARDLGLYYEGTVNGAGTWTTLAPTVSGGETLLNTIAHSNHGNLLVGNYDTSLATGRAFIFDITGGTYTELVKPGAASITAYGIWHNGGDSYTIAGGFSNVNSGGLDVGYLVDWDAGTGIATHWTEFYYNNDNALITHFDGITSDGAGGYNLTGDWIGVGEENGLGFFANVGRAEAGGFDEATWLSINYPSSEGLDVDETSGNTVYENYVMGIYTANGEGLAQGYVAAVPEPGAYALLGGLLTLGYATRRRKRVAGV